MKRILSFSLYGSAPLYLQGALRNVQLAPSIYPGWTPRIYASHEIPTSLLDAMKQAGAEVIVKQRKNLIDGMFWRFLPAMEPDVDAMVVRDVDSRITPREFAAVQEWIRGGKSIHIMRDHPCHKVVMLGGMWGCRGSSIPDMDELINAWNLWAKKGQDQDFLRDMIYPRFRNDCCVHSELYAYGDEIPKAFPIARHRGEFVGCVYDADRDTLTDAQHAEYEPLFSNTFMKRLPASKPKPKLYLVAEQWIRNLRQLGKKAA